MKKQIHNQKVIVVTRQDLEPGYQLVQSVHSAFDFSLEFPEVTKDWNTQSNYLACLAAKDEASLFTLISKLEAKGIQHTVFREPDIDNQVTAVAIAPGETSRKLTSNYPLALRTENKIIEKLLSEKKELIECIQNLMGAFDTPVARLKMGGEFSEEVRRLSRATLSNAI